MNIWCVNLLRVIRNFQLRKPFWSEINLNFELCEPFRVKA